RRPDEELVQRHYDVAASVQKAFEETLFHLLRWLAERTGSRNLCMAGGCALNSLANGRIAGNTPFERFFYQPAAHDAGGALGSALYLRHGLLGLERRAPAMRHAYYGPGFGEAECRAALQQAGVRYE